MLLRGVIVGEEIIISLGWLVSVFVCPHIEINLKAENLNLNLGYKYETVVLGELRNWARLDPDFLQTAFAPSDGGGRSQSRICLDNQLESIYKFQ